MILIFNENFYKNNILHNFEGGNIYVYSKFPEQLKSSNSYLKNYLINKEAISIYRDISVIKEILLLLTTALKNKNNEYFILLNGNSYPIKDNYNIKLELEKNNLSIFNLINIYSNKYINFDLYKTSSSWVIKRCDVELIIKKANKYIKIFEKYEIYTNIKKTNKKIYIGNKLLLNETVDQVFFLTLLMNEKKNNYIFKPFKIVYTKLIDISNKVNSFIINKLTPYDINIFNNSNIFFIKNISPYFEFKLYQRKEDLMHKTLIIVYINKIIEYNNDNQTIKNIFIKYNLNKSDIILFYGNNGEKNKTLIEQLSQISICYINLTYSNFMEIFMLFYIKNQDFFKQWGYGTIFPEIIELV